MNTCSEYVFECPSLFTVLLVSIVSLALRSGGHSSYQCGDGDLNIASSESDGEWVHGFSIAVCLGVPKEYCDCALLPLFVHLFMVLFLGMSDSPTEEDRECDDHCIISESHDFTPKWIGCDCSTFIVLV